MKLDLVETKQLLYAEYRYNHCNGDCSSCPCHSEEGYYCYHVHEEIRKELNKRGE